MAEPNLRSVTQLSLAQETIEVQSPLFLAFLLHCPPSDYDNRTSIGEILDPLNF